MDHNEAYLKGVERCLRLIVRRVDEKETIADACLDDVSNIDDWAEFDMSVDEFAGFSATMAIVEQVTTVELQNYLDLLATTDSEMPDAPAEVKS